MGNEASVQGCGCAQGNAGAGLVSGAGEVSGPVCALPQTELGARIGAFRALLKGSFVERSRDVDGVVWRLVRSAHVEQESRRLAALESNCCAPLAFTVDVDADHVIWRITGSANAARLLDAFYQLPSEVVSTEITGRPAGGVLVGIGVACAACCAAPFALPWLLAAVAPVVGGLASWQLGSAELACIGAIVGAAVLVAMLVSRYRRHPRVR